MRVSEQNRIMEDWINENWLYLMSQYFNIWFIMFQQSLDAVGEDLTAVRNELQQLGDVIQGKDMEIEQLERQLRVVRQQLSDK